MHATQLPEAVRTGRRPVELRRAVPLSAAITSIALLAAACGSSSPTTSGSSSVKSPAAVAFKFAECMRQHGVSNFPDPTVSSSQPGEQSVRIAVPASAARSPQAQSARKACRGILPQPSAAQVAQEQHAREQHMLAFAECVRNHGGSGFPDPTSQGQLSLRMLSAAGIDVRAPAVQTAALTCVPAAGGAITAADVRAAATAGR